MRPIREDKNPRMKLLVEYSIIVETFTFNEGGDGDRFRAVLRAATHMISQDENGEVLVTDACGLPELKEMLRSEFPQVRRIEATGLGYDGAKVRAVQETSGRYILFLDGDCIPEPGWHHHLLEVLRSERAVAVGGFTHYEGGFLAAVMSVMDFGFLYPCIQRPLQCFASNNCGFLREALEEIPVPDGAVRCRCFYHAQLFLRRGTPVQLVPEARVWHERQPLIRERSRQGYDLIAACWTDPALPEARWLRWGILALPLFYTARVLLDWKRLWIGRKDLVMALWQVVLTLPLFPLLRLIDAAGMVRAFITEPVKGGWGGWFLRDRSSEKSC